MSIVFSHRNVQDCFAKYDEKNVFLRTGNIICGSFDSGKVFDVDGNLVATYTGNILRSVDGNTVLVVKDKNIFCNDDLFACYQGRQEGACAAAYLFYRYQGLLEKKTEPQPTNYKRIPGTDTFWTFTQLWENVKSRASTLVKIVLAIFAAVVFYFMWQLPQVLAYLMEGEMGIMVILIWGGAFLFGFRRKSYPLLKKISHILALFWETLVPFLHAIWITVVAVSIYALAKGFFSSAYLAGVIQLLPAIVFSFSLPLCMIHFVRLIYLLYKYNR